MNIYEKLNAARLRFLKSGAKMSGRNAFANYSYFELSDILPIVNKAAAELGFTCVVRFGKEDATLEVIDAAMPNEKITFTSPMASAQLKGCHEVQNLGAAESYVRRYLYLTAFEIVESDALDATMNPQEAQESTRPQEKEEPLTDEQAQEKIKELLTATYPDGSLIFTAEEKASWWKRFRKNPLSTIYFVQKEKEAREKSAAAQGA